MTDEQNLPEAQTSESDESDLVTRRKGTGRYMARSVRAFVQWLPAGATGVPLLSMVLQQEWTQALLLFPANVLTGGWAAYSNGFMDTFEGICAERSKKDARSFVKWMDAANEALMWQFSRFDAKYLKRQAERHNDYYGTDDTKQPEGIFQVDLEDVFVPLRLDFSMGDFQRRGRKRIEDCDESLEIWDVLKRSKSIPTYKNLAILADGGSGKTTMLRCVSYLYGTGGASKYGVPKLLPFLLYLRQWRDEIAANPAMTLAELMEKSVRDLRDWEKVKFPPRWAENLLRNGRALILFDGFDEVADEQRSIVGRWISDGMEKYPKSLFILTSRPAGYDAYKEHAAEVPMTLMVREFSETERDTFARKWYLAQERVRRGGKMTAEAGDRAGRKAADLIGQIKSSEELQKMAVNPLLLNLLARLHNFCPDEALPQRRTELYQEICDLQLGARPAAKRIVMLLNKPQKRQKVLQAVALEMVEGNTVQLKKGRMLDLMRGPLNMADERADVAVFLQQISEVSELLHEPVPMEYAFSHLSFRNYFAALEVSRSELVQHWHEDWWRETVLLHSMVCEPMELWALVQAAIREHPENVHLGYDCLVRYPGKRIEPGWIDAIRPLRYKMLERLTKEGKWEEADQETYRLMISTCKKDAGKVFTGRDIQTFPCEDLLTIDRLWVEASNGHFGFSVQKKIWEKCGSPMDYNDDYKKFMETVGWRSGLDFVSYSDLKFSLSHSLEGELPTGNDLRAWVGFLDGEGVLNDTLFSRNDL